MMATLAETCSLLLSLLNTFKYCCVIDWPQTYCLSTGVLAYVDVSEVGYFSWSERALVLLPLRVWVKKLKILSDGFVLQNDKGVVAPWRIPRDPIFKQKKNTGIDNSIHLEGSRREIFKRSHNLKSRGLCQFYYKAMAHVKVMTHG